MKVKEGERMKFWLSKKEKGITLVALVITIIVLLILAGVSIATLTGDNGILTKASEAKEKTEAASRKEQDDIEEILSTLDDYEGGSLEGLTKEQKVKYVNSPRLLSGMTKIMFKDPTETEKGKTLRSGDAEFKEDSWYNYDEKKWANVETKDGSMWVWIPRFAYKITSQPSYEGDVATRGGTIEVRFLIGTTDKYFDENGQEQTAKRVTESGADTSKDFYVHPAFTNESGINYKNGGWDKELRGIWVAKFEAGYAQGNNYAAVKATNLTYTQEEVYVGGAENEKVPNKEGWDTARNWLDGVYGANKMTIKYPVFMGTTYSMNYINHNDAFLLAKEISAVGNPYGLSSAADSHMMKDSEWGAVAYLSQSQYGLNGTNIYINNVCLNSGGKQRTLNTGKTGIESIYAITGLTTGSSDTSELILNTEQAKNIIEEINTVKGNTSTTTGNIYTWEQLKGIGASTTGTIYGIYDLSGGVLEKTAAYVANDSSNISKYGASLINNGKMIATKYVMVYTKGIKDEEQTNYETNEGKVFGNAIGETSIKGSGASSWFNDYSHFPYGDCMFSVYGGCFLHRANAGLFFFGSNDGPSGYHVGFRVTLVSG